MKRLVSGIQPSGSLHLGNYLGAIKNWKRLQDDYECFIFLADLHTITVPKKPEDLTNSIIETTAAYIASGIDPKKCIIFPQSSVSEHAELSWILSCITSMGLINRMTQFKDKAGKDKEKASLGLYSYPVLMAADILIYNADIVPVGEDQKQHLELTRDIAQTFNRIFNKEHFTIPEPMITGVATRVMSLKDGKAKMSKSDPSDNSRINLTDDKDTIIRKFKKSKSDSLSFISFDKEERPEVSNLLNIYSALSDKKIDQIVAEFEGRGFAEFKTELADIAVEKLSPINNEIVRLVKDKSYILDILKQGSNRASISAKENLDQVKNIFGFLSL